MVLELRCVCLARSARSARSACVAVLCVLSVLWVLAAPAACAGAPPRTPALAIIEGAEGPQLTRNFPWAGLVPPQVLQYPRAKQARKNVSSIPILRWLNYSVLEPFAGACQVHVISSGFLTVPTHARAPNGSASAQTVYRNLSIPDAALLVSCNDSAATAALREFAYNVSLIREISREWPYGRELRIPPLRMLAKDRFNTSVVIITFCYTCLAVGSWMMFLIVSLLPSTNHNRRKRLVLVYVLFGAIFVTISLRNSIHNVFIRQYRLNYQSTQEFENYILKSTTNRACQFVWNMLSNLNWIQIFFYMYPIRIEFRHVPWRQWAHYKTFWFMILGSLCFIGDTIAFAYLLWLPAARLRVRVVYHSFELVFVILFTACLVIYIWNNFAFVITVAQYQENIESDNAGRYWNDNESVHPTENVTTGPVLAIRHKLMIFWKNYYDILPLLIYNVIVILVLFGLKIIFADRSYHSSRWIYLVGFFFKMVVTVNTWGLIGVLESREMRICKKTVLGRQIDGRYTRFKGTPGSDLDTGSIFSQSSSTLKYNVDLDESQDRADIIPNLLKGPGRTLRPGFLSIKNKRAFWKHCIPRRARPPTNVTMHQTMDINSIADSNSFFDANLEIDEPVYFDHESLIGSGTNHQPLDYEHQD